MRAFSLTDVYPLPAAAFYSISTRSNNSTSGVITWLVKEGWSCRRVLWQCIHELKMEHPDRSVDLRRWFEVALLERAIHSGRQVRPVRARTKPQAARQMALLVHARSCSGTTVRLGQCRRSLSFTPFHKYKESATSTLSMHTPQPNQNAK